MSKLLKLSTLALILTSQAAFAGMTWEHVKEEMWLKGESSLYQKAKFVGEVTVIELPTSEAQDLVQEQEIWPVELEVAMTKLGV